MPSLLAIILLALGAFTHAGQWPQFRGPGAMGVAESPALPDTWSSR